MLLQTTRAHKEESFLQQSLFTTDNNYSFHTQTQFKEEVPYHAKLSAVLSSECNRYVYKELLAFERQCVLCKLYSQVLCTRASNYVICSNFLFHSNYRTLRGSIYSYTREKARAILSIKYTVPSMDTVRSKVGNRNQSVPATSVYVR